MDEDDLVRLIVAETNGIKKGEIGRIAGYSEVFPGDICVHFSGGRNVILDPKHLEKVVDQALTEQANGTLKKRIASAAPARAFTLEEIAEAFHDAALIGLEDRVDGWESMKLELERIARR